MKNVRSFLFLLMLLPIWMACDKMDSGSYVAPISLYEKVAGSWQLSSIKMVDELARTASIKPDEMILTAQLNFTTFHIDLLVDDKNNPTTYQVTGSSPQLFPTTGYWSLDTAFPNTNGMPVHINLYSDEAKTQLTTQLSIVATPGTKSEMEFKLTRISNGSPSVSYQYKVVKM